MGFIQKHPSLRGRTLSKEEGSFLELIFKMMNIIPGNRPSIIEVLMNDIWVNVPNEPTQDIIKEIRSL
jgi:hypothetical protein